MTTAANARSQRLVVMVGESCTTTAATASVFRRAARPRGGWLRFARGTALDDRHADVLTAELPCCAAPRDEDVDLAAPDAAAGVETRVRPVGYALQPLHANRAAERDELRIGRDTAAPRALARAGDAVTAIRRRRHAHPWIRLTLRSGLSRNRNQARQHRDDCDAPRTHTPGVCKSNAVGHRAHGGSG